MRVMILQHEPKEWIGSMASWFKAKNYVLTTRLLYRHEALPSVDEFDWLVVMGGAMSVYEEDKYAWLAPEKQLIRQTIEAGKKVLGICLGGQLIANALGAKVYPGEQQEIGWFPVIRTDDIASWCPDEFTPLSWHGDRFDLPEGATAFAQSAVTPYQGFTLSNKVWALQFHLEATTESVHDFYEVGGGLDEGEYIQSYQHMFEHDQSVASQPVMHALLNTIDKA
jgi:GMP synthase (glutamine-hydrolysing)